MNNMDGKQQRTQEALDEQITDLVSEIRQSQEIIAEHENQIHEAKERLTQLLSERGSNWSDDSGYARLVSEGTRIAYDTSALDELIIHEPLRYGWLKDYRTEQKISSRIQVK